VRNIQTDLGLPTLAGLVQTNTADRVMQVLNFIFHSHKLSWLHCFLFSCKKAHRCWDCRGLCWLIGDRLNSWWGSCCGLDGFCLIRRRLVAGRRSYFSHTTIEVRWPNAQTILLTTLLVLVNNTQHHAPSHQAKSKQICWAVKLAGATSSPYYFFSSPWHNQPSHGFARER
jgi:hypothetical protein